MDAFACLDAGDGQGTGRLDDRAGVLEHVLDGGADFVRAHQQDLVDELARQPEGLLTHAFDRNTVREYADSVERHARGIQHELLYRFEFPERPGALLRFLQAIGSRWNISLFHYRNHGSDYGRVMAGIQVPPGERSDFIEHLRELHYAYTEETANTAYKIFLGA